MSFLVRSRLTKLASKFINPTYNNAFLNKSKIICLHTTNILDAQQEIKMPSLSPTMTEGTIVKWLKKEGDTVAPGDVLCEIQTDKAVMSFETEEEGILAKILVPENTTDVKVGTLIAVMVEEGEDWQNVSVSATSPSATASASSASPPPPAPSSGGSVPGQIINMPSLSPTMTEGTIVKWLKKEGDAVVPGDVLCEIQTDKAVMSFETEEEGILAKILVPENTKDVKVGTLIALMVGEGEDWKDVAIPGAAAPSAAPSAGVVTPPSGGSVQGQEIKMPSLSPTMTEGTIVKWHKKEGDTVAPGDVLCDIQTDKAVMSFETEEEGILAKILVPADSLVTVGKLIALMVSEGEDWKDVAIPGSAPSPAAPAPATPKPAPAPSVSAPAHHPPKPHEYGPAVHRLLEQYQLSSKDITATGRNSKLLKSDVLKFIEDKKLQPLPPLPVAPKATSTAAPLGTAAPAPAPSKPLSGYTDIEVSSMRRTIAKRLTESKSDIDKTLALRAQLKSAGITVSVNDFVIKAVALALRQCPLVNCLYTKDEVVSHPSIDISVAVATDNGLITPIVKNADSKPIDAISAEVKELANKARQNKLQLHEFQGGSFTISNLGMFGISEFSAIINPPQCAILAVGGGQPYVDIKGNPVTRMTAQLSYDARAISETAAAEFLQVLKLYLENPAALVISSPGTQVQTRAYAN
ncbi:hypothetical protein M8J76_008863 [Diaphorina citri]|nr:hypothetical protein M8J76_008863 [Diaphorina citri]